MTDLPDIIAEAARVERGKYTILTGHHDPDARLWLTKELTQGDAGPILADTEAACEAHLERLVAMAVLTRIRAAGYAVVPVEPDLIEVARGFCCEGGKCENVEKGYACVADRFLWSARNAIAQEASKP